MRKELQFSITAAVLFGLSLSAPLIAQEGAQKKASEKAGEKAGGEKAPAEKKGPDKVVGDIGLLDTEKNYMIVVTKEGKLVTLDFDPKKTKVVQNKEEPVKISDVGLGSSAVVEYTEKGDKKMLTKMEFTPAKGE
jgi:hypothetical protein